MHSIDITTDHGFAARHYSGDLWRLVHNGVTVLALIPPGGVTSTLAPYLTVGMETELRDEIAGLGLHQPVEPALDIPSSPSEG